MCVGVIFCSKGGPKEGGAGKVETGSMVAARMERRRGKSGYRRLIVLSASRGPKTSKAWKMGKRTSAKWRGALSFV